MKTTSLEQNIHPQEHTPLSVCVVEKIAADHVHQAPRWKFLVEEYGVWLLWVASILFGALALSAMLFVVMHSGFIFYEATHDRVIDFALEVLPYLWIGVFVLMAYLSHYNLRHTKRGYRYPVWFILGSSVACSLAGGLVMHVAGMGYIVDTHAGKTLPLYPTLEEREFRIWQAPEQGRLIGVYQRDLDDMFVVSFVDAQGVTWSLNTAELNPRDLEQLHTQEHVKVIGVLSTSTQAYFHGCGVLPFASNRAVSIKDMRTQREMFIQHMSEHRTMAISTALATSSAVAQAARVCANHTAVLRVLQHNKK